MHSLPAETPPSPGTPAPNAGPANPWQTCVVPLVVFLAAGALDPTPSGGGLAGWLGIPYSAYPVLYAVRLALTIVAIAFAWPALRPWLGRASWWPALLGLALVVPWVALAILQRDAGWATAGLERTAFNPFAQFADSPALAWGFLCLRLVGLVVVRSSKMARVQSRRRPATSKRVLMVRMMPCRRAERACGQLLL